MPSGGGSAFAMTLGLTRAMGPCREVGACGLGFMAVMDWAMG